MNNERDEIRGIEDLPDTYSQLETRTPSNNKVFLVNTEMILENGFTAIVLNMFYPTLHARDNIVGLLRIHRALAIDCRTDTVIGYEKPWRNRLLLLFKLGNMLLLVGIHVHTNRRLRID